MQVSSLASTDQLKESLEAVKGDPPWLAYVAAPTVASRLYAKQALIAIQLAYLSAVLAIAIGEFAHPDIPATTLGWWIAESFGNFGIRMFLYARFMFPARPIQFTGSRGARVIPLVTNVIVGIHWCWTTYLFAGPPNAMLLVIVVSYLLMSVASISIASSSPVTAVMYPAFLWIPLLWRLSAEGWVAADVLLVLIVGITGTLVMAFFTITRHVRKYLMKNDEALVLLDEVHKANAGLRQSNEELAAHRAQVQAELEARSEYFASVNHDLRQRLHATKLLAQSMASAHEQVDNMATGTVGRLRESLDQLESYLSRMLEFARLESSSQEIAWEWVALQDVFQQVDVQFEDIAESCGVELRVRATSKVLYTDRTMITRLLENLVSNAVKFSRPGRKVLVAARSRRGGVSIEVWDQGPGIPPSARQVVFKPFHQLSYYGRRKDGVGMGLAIVERLARSLGCEVDVLSRDGKGTAMKLLVPSVGECIQAGEQRHE